VAIILNFELVVVIVDINVKFPAVQFWSISASAAPEAPIPVDLDGHAYNRATLWSLWLLAKLLVGNIFTCLLGNQHSVPHVGH